MSTGGIDLDVMSREQLLAEVGRLRRERDEVLNALGRAWYGECEIIPNYMPPYPRPDTKPTVVIRHKPSGLFLRYSKGPRTGSFWDIYGEDFHDIELAKSELWKAPPPRIVDYNAMLERAALARVAPPDGQGVGR
jgi:hypothetical protein